MRSALTLSFSEVVVEERMVTIGNCFRVRNSILLSPLLLGLLTYCNNKLLTLKILILQLISRNSRSFFFLLCTLEVSLCISGPSRFLVLLPQFNALERAPCPSCGKKRACCSRSITLTRLLRRYRFLIVHIEKNITHHVQDIHLLRCLRAH